MNPVAARRHQRCFAVGRNDARIGAVSEQQLHQFDIAGERRPHQRGCEDDTRRTFAHAGARGVELIMAFGFAPASSIFLMSGSGSRVTIHGKLGAVSMLRRSTAQNSGVKR